MRDVAEEALLPSDVFAESAGHVVQRFTELSEFIATERADADTELPLRHVPGRARHLPHAARDAAHERQPQQHRAREHARAGPQPRSDVEQQTAGPEPRQREQQCRGRPETSVILKQRRADADPVHRRLSRTGDEFPVAARPAARQHGLAVARHTVLQRRPVFAAFAKWRPVLGTRRWSVGTRRPSVGKITPWRKVAALLRPRLESPLRIAGRKIAQVIPARRSATRPSRRKIPAPFLAWRTRRLRARTRIHAALRELLQHRRRRIRDRPGDSHAVILHRGDLDVVRIRVAFQDCRPFGALARMKLGHDERRHSLHALPGAAREQRVEPEAELPARDIHGHASEQDEVQQKARGDFRRQRKWDARGLRPHRSWRGVSGHRRRGSPSCSPRRARCG